MPLTQDPLVEVINSAWKTALEESECIEGKPKGVVHRKRSKRWVCCLARAFQNWYSDRDDCRVFWRDNCGNEKHFRMNEFLFDVTVATVGTTKSQQHKPEDLHYISRCEWAIESELNQRDSREVIIDMSKLVVADADNKLFVASQRNGCKDDEKVLKQCKPIAESCRGRVYFCFIAHPKHWCEKCDPPRLYLLTPGTVWHPVQVN